MKRFLLIVIIVISAALFGANHLLSQDGKGGQHALIVKGTDSQPVAFVTGATGKIAREIIQQLDQKGYRLILQARDENQLKEFSQQLNNPELIIADLTQAEDRGKVVQLIKERTPELLINNAAVAPMGPVLDAPIDALNHAITVNCLATTDLTIAAIKAMQAKQRQGIVLNLSSFTAQIGPLPNLAVYSATKAFISDFSQALDYELKETGIRVLTSHPGKVATRLGLDPKDRDVISISDAARAIIEQIEGRETNVTFDSYYRVLGGVSEWLPRNIKLWLLSWRHEEPVQPN